MLVLGYSPRRPAGLHPICAARVEHAAGVIDDGDVVVLSGTDGELELMGGAWGGADVEPRRDPALRTADSAVAAVRLAEEVGADEVVVVTSWWHRPRAELMLRSALRRRGSSRHRLGRARAVVAVPPRPRGRVLPARAAAPRERAAAGAGVAASRPVD